MRKVEIAALKGEVADARHLKTGSLHGGGSSSWSYGTGNTYHNGHSYFNKEKKMSHTFQKDYIEPSVVFLSTSYLEIISENQGINYGTQLLNVDKHGFAMRCGSWISFSANTNS